MKEKEPTRMETIPEHEATEILPVNIGDLSAREAAPLLKRAASRIDIVKPKTPFWQGMADNLKGAAAYIEEGKARVASKAFRAVAGASLVTTMVAACAKPPETPYLLPTEPVVTQPTEAPTETATPTPTETPTLTPTPTETATPTEVPIDLPIVRRFEMNKFQDLPEITIEQAQSPAFEKFLDEAEEKGLLGDFPATARPFEPVYVLVSFNDRAVNRAFYLPSDLGNKGTYSDISIRPCYNAAYFRTSMNGEDYILWVQKWKNTDGTIGRIKYVYSYKLLQSVQPRYDVMSLFGFTTPSKKGMLVPGIPGENPDYSIYWGFDESYFKNYWQENKGAMLNIYHNLAQNRPKSINTSDYTPYLWTPVGTLTRY